MSAHRWAYDAYKADRRIPDPGDAGTIALEAKDFGICRLDSAGAETRTLGRPTKIGQRVVLQHETFGGIITVTVTGGFNNAGDTSFATVASGSAIDFVGIETSAGTYAWRVVGSESISGITEVLGSLDLNGEELILDADADTTITADTNDQIDVKIANADDFRFTANTFTALSGSTIATNTIAETTAATGVTIDGVLLKDNNATVTNLDAGASGTAGSVNVFPATASKGKLAITCTNQTGDTTVGLVAGAMGQATVVTIPDPGVSTASLIHNQGGQTIGGATTFTRSATGVGGVAIRLGGTAGEGLEFVVYNATVSPAAVETNLLNTPAGAVILSVQGNCESALTGGGTTVTWSVGTAADPDKYGTAGDGAGDTLLKNGKLNRIPDWAVLAAAEQMVLTGCATGGAADGDTALTVGSVRVRVLYLQTNSLDDAA